jgi:glyoxylase-like metal-dependent hydrolase (beta-lactamase superfamily II)
MRRIKALFFTAVVLAVIGGGAVMGMRIGREKFTPPTEIKPGLSGIKSAGGIYIYAARAGKHAVLFDTGADPGGRPVDALLAALGAGRADVREIFLSHGHFDHVSGLSGFPHARSYLGAGDLGLASGTVLPDALLGKLLTKAMQPLPVTITDPLKGPATVTLSDGKTVKALPVPGHTAGSYAYLYDGVLFPGDIMVFKEGRLETTPFLFDAHPDENKAAIRSLKAQLAAETVETVCTAHGGCTPKGLGRNLLEDLIGRVGG